MSIGETLAEERQRAGLSVTQVSLQTRIRETVIRGMEADDFSLCGGNFYARGHIRSISRVIGIDPEPLVAECDFGEWQGLTAVEIEARWPGELRRWHEDASVRAPGGESIEDVGNRMRAGLAAIRDAGVDRTVVVVSHSVSVRAAVGVAIGAQSSSWARIRVAPASVSIIRLFPDGTSEVSVVGCPSET